MKAKLSADVVSVFFERREVIDKKAKSGYKIETGNRIYGKKDEEVIVISEHGNVSIVEGKNGERFTVNNDNLIIQK